MRFWRRVDRTRHEARRCGVFAVIAALTLVGCDSGKSPGTNTAAQTNASSTSANAVKAASNPKAKNASNAAAAVTAEAVPRNLPVEKEDKAGLPAENASDADAKQEEIAPAPERIAILTPGGPLLVDVSLSIDGRPHGEGLAKLIAEAIREADANSDGRASWQELTLLKSTPEAAAANAGDPPGMWADRFDWNRDGDIQPREAAAWLGRSANASAMAFALRSSRGYSPHPRSTSRVWKLIDGDENGQLTREEWELASAELAKYDANDDRVVAAAELATLREALAAGDGDMSTRTSSSDRYAALHLEPSFGADRLEYLLADMYAPRQDLAPESFRAFPQLGTALDADGDKWLNQRELSGLLQVEPHLKLAVSFTRSATAEKGPAIVELGEVAAEVREVDRARDRATVDAGGARIILTAQDLAAGEQDASPQAVQVRLMVHDQCDALFELLDENVDGRLGERELAGCAARFQRCDADGDGQLAASELPYAMNVAFLRGERAGEMSFYVPQAERAGVGAESPRWFEQADFNGDGDVSRREFLGDITQFAAIDANGDEFIDAGEAAAVKSP